MSWGRVRTVARTDLKQLIQDKGFWLPMMILGGIFFLVIPTILLLAITRVSDVHVVQQLSTTLKVLPESAQHAIKGHNDQGRAAYALAVFLLGARGRGGPAHHLDRSRRVDHRGRARARHGRVPRPLPRRCP